MWEKGDRVQGLVYDMSRGYKILRRGTVVRTVAGRFGQSLTEVLFDSPPRSQPTEIIAFSPSDLAPIKREVKKVIFGLRG